MDTDSFTVSDWIARIAAGLRPVIPPDVPTRMSQLIIAMLDEEPVRRPRLCNVVASLERMAEVEAAAEAEVGPMQDLWVGFDDLMAQCPRWAQAILHGLALEASKSQASASQASAATSLASACTSQASACTSLAFAFISLAFACTSQASAFTSQAFASQDCLKLLTMQI